MLDPHPEGLAAAATIVRANADRRATLFANVKNHFQGAAPRLIQRLLEVLASHVAMPSALATGSALFGAR